MVDRPLLPLKLEIPIPSEIPRARGIHSTAKFGEFLKIRISLDERLLIDEQAQRIGVKRSQFIRWAAVQMAKALTQHEV